MKYETETFTSTCCHAKVPDEFKGRERETIVDLLNEMADKPCRLKDGIVVSADALDESDRDGFPVAFIAMLDYLRNFKPADEYLFHE